MPCPDKISMKGIMNGMTNPATKTGFESYEFKKAKGILRTGHITEKEEQQGC